MDGRTEQVKGSRIPRPPAVVMLVGYSMVATALGLLLGWLVVRNMEWGKLGGALASANIALIFAAWFLVIVSGYLRGLRWRLLLADDRVSAIRLFLIEQAGTAIDTVSPIRVLDEIVEIGILTLRDGLRLGTVLATLALQRTFEFGTTVLLLGIGAMFLPPFRPFWPYLTAGVVFGSLSLILLFTVGPALRHVKFLSRIEVVPQFASAVVLMRRERWRSGLAFVISIAQAVLVGLAGWMVARATGIGLGVPTMIVITLGIMFFSSTVPGLPMAIGTFEFAAVSILRLWNVDAEQAIAFSLLIHAVLFIPPIIFAAVFLPRIGLLSFHELKELASKTRQGMTSAGQSRYLR